MRPSFSQHEGRQLFAQFIQKNLLPQKISQVSDAIAYMYMWIRNLQFYDLEFQSYSTHTLLIILDIIFSRRRKSTRVCATPPVHSIPVYSRKTRKKETLRFHR